MGGFFGYFDFEKPGKGVNEDGPKKKGFFHFFELYGRKIVKLVQLNLLYILCCIPVVTIGPATAGLTYVLRNFAREEHSWVVSDFFEQCKKNLKQGLIVGNLNLLIWVVLVYDFLFFSGWQGFEFMRFFILALGVLFAIMNFFIYSIMVTFDIKVIDIYKNAMILTAVRLPVNFLMLVTVGALVFILLNIHPLIAILIALALAFSTIGFIITYYVQPIIRKYLMASDG